MRTARPLRLDPNHVSATKNRWGQRTLAERFWSHVDKSGECWIWTGRLNPKGYGSFGIGKKRTAPAHRVAWVITNGGELPANALVLHSLECTSRACVRPDHLRLGDQKENVADMMALGRANCQRSLPPWVLDPSKQWARDPRAVLRDARGRIIGRAQVTAEASQ